MVYCSLWQILEKQEHCKLQQQNHQGMYELINLISPFITLHCCTDDWNSSRRLVIPDEVPDEVALERILHELISGDVSIIVLVHCLQYLLHTGQQNLLLHLTSKGVS